MKPTGQTLIEAIVPEMLDIGLPMIAGVAVLLWIMGRASLRALQDAPEEIPHRAEMEWGARWYWVVTVASLLIPVSAMLAALAKTAWPVTVAVLAGLSIGPIHFALDNLMPWQLEGQFLWVASRRRRDGETLREVTDRLWHRRCTRCARWVRGGIAVLYAGLIAWAATTTVPLDRQIMRFDRADRLGAQIAEGIGSSEITGAHVIFDGMLPRVSGNRVLIEVKTGRSEAAVRKIVDAAEPVVQEVLPAGAWTIRAWSEDGGEFQRVVVNPEGSAEDI